MFKLQGSDRVLLNRLKDAVDQHLRDHKARFRKNRSRTDQVVTCASSWSSHWNGTRHFTSILKTMRRHSTELTVNVFGSYWGITETTTSIIQNSYEGLTCSVMHNGQLSDAFPVRTGVRHGCLLSTFLFLFAIDWIMKQSTSQNRNGIRWTSQSQLDDVDFADDLALLSHTQQQMQEKTNTVAEHSARLGQNIYRRKSRSSKWTQPVQSQSHWAPK